MGRSKTKVNSDALVKCPFCKEMMKAKRLADHAKRHHGNDPKFSEKTKPTETRLLEGIEVENADMVQHLNQLVVDESGFLVNPRLLEEERRKSRDERMGTVPHPVPPSSKRKNKSNIANPRVRSLKTDNDDSFRNKVDWLDKVFEAEKADPTDQTEFVKCPVCRSILKPTKLKNHIAKYHPGNSLTKAQTRRNKIETQGKSLESVRQPSKKLYKQSNLVKCPLCQQMMQYDVLYVHIQVSHPEIDSKLVMTKFKRLYKNKDRSVQHRYEEEMNGLLQRYEKLKQRNGKP